MCLLYHFLFKSLIVEVDYKRCVTTTDLLMLYCNQKKAIKCQLYYPSRNVCPSRLELKVSLSIKYFGTGWPDLT